MAKAVGPIAVASMYIFLVHWQVWPPFTWWLDRRVAFVATLAVGVGAWLLVQRAVAELLGRTA